MLRGLITASVFVVVFAFLLLSVSRAMAYTESIQGGRMQITTPTDDALARDAQEYARVYGVDQQEALQRLERQRLIGQLGADLEANESGTYAGLWIQHRPDYRVIALFTRDGAQTLQRHVAGRPLSGVVEAREAKLTLLQLQAAQNTVIRALRSLGIAADSRINVPENRTEILVTDRVRIDAALGLGELQLPDGVVIVTVPGLLQTAVSACRIQCRLHAGLLGERA